MIIGIGNYIGNQFKKIYGFFYNQTQNSVNYFIF